MNYIIYEDGQPAGELTIQPSGLYYEIKARVNKSGRIRRIYGIQKSGSFCIGVPDKDGALFRRISQSSFVNAEQYVISEFLPLIEDDFSVEPVIEPCSEKNDTDKENGVIEKLVSDIEEIEIPYIDTDNGGIENEAHLPNDSSDIDPLLLANLPADYDYGGNGTEETHSDYL